MKFKVWKTGGQYRFEHFNFLINPIKIKMKKQMGFWTLKKKNAQLSLLQFADIAPLNKKWISWAHSSTLG